MIEKLKLPNSLSYIAVNNCNQKNNVKGKNILQIKSVNLNNQPNAHYGRISFGIDDAGKKPVAKRIDGSVDYQANRELIQAKRTNLESNLEERMADESKCFDDASRSIEFYPEDMEKLEQIKDIDEQIEFLSYLRKERRFHYTDENLNPQNTEQHSDKNSSNHLQKPK